MKNHGKITDNLNIKARELQEYANSIDNQGLTYSCEDALKFIQSTEEEEGREISIEEFKELLFDMQFCGL